MGPFLAASIGETTEWFNSGTERWRKRGGGGAEDKEAEESGERREEKELVQRRVQTAGFNQQQAVGNEITIPLRSD